MNGFEDHSFRPEHSITRAEFAALLSRTLKLQAAEGLNFSDAADIPAWVQPQLGALVKAGIMNGYEDGTFRPERLISRAELAVIVSRVLALNVDEQATSSFDDSHDIPSWAQSQVAAANQNGILSGRGNNMFAPNENVTRAEAVVVILALYDKMK